AFVTVTADQLAVGGERRGAGGQAQSRPRAAGLSLVLLELVGDDACAVVGVCEDDDLHPVPSSPCRPYVVAYRGMLSSGLAAANPRSAGQSKACAGAAADDDGASRGMRDAPSSLS